MQCDIPTQKIKTVKLFPTTDANPQCDAIAATS